MISGRKRQFEPVGDGKAAFFGRAGPLVLPDFSDGAFGSSFGIGSCGTEQDLAFQFHCILGECICSVVASDVAVARAPGY